MITFNQQGQTVHGNQFNAENITNNFGEVRSNTEFTNELKKIIELISLLETDNEIEKVTANEVTANINEAIVHAEQEKPDQDSISSYLGKAKELVSGVSGLATAIGAAITAIGVVF